MSTHPETQPTSTDGLNGPSREPAEKQRLIALGRRSLLAFWRDLSQLLKTHPRQWAAYSGDVRLGIGPTRYELWQECERRGYKDGEFLICYIETQDPAFVEAFDQPLPPEPESE